MKYRKILLAYNGSQEGKRALFVAAFLQAETHLLAVASMPPSLFLTEGFVPEELLVGPKGMPREVVKVLHDAFGVSEHPIGLGIVVADDPVDEFVRESVGVETECRCSVVEATLK